MPENTIVRDLVARSNRLGADRRETRGLPRDPMAAYAGSGYQQRIEAERAGGTQASWGS